MRGFRLWHLKKVAQIERIVGLQMSISYRDVNRLFSIVRRRRTESQSSLITVRTAP